MSVFDTQPDPLEWDVESPEFFPAQAPHSETKDASPMYEPDEPARSDTSSQWAPYDNTAFIPPVPPQDDYAPEPFGYSQPPPGRMYAQQRQPPTWQHASTQGWAEEASNWGGLLQGLSAIAGSVAIGYVLTSSIKTAAGAGLGMAGLLQVPLLLQGNFIRPLLGVGAIAGAYFLLRDDLQIRPNWDGGDDYESNEDEEEYEENDEDEGDEEGDGDEPEPTKGPKEPVGSPWLKPSP